MKKIIFAIVALCCFSGAFSENEDLKKQILSSANLAGESMDDLMADDTDEVKKDDKNVVRRLPSEFDRDVVFGEAMKALMKAYYNHEAPENETQENLYKAAIAEANANGGEYEKLVNLARADYYRGIFYLENYDYTSIEDINFADSSDIESPYEKAGKLFDSGIEKAEKAVKIKAGSDAYTIWAHLIAANCTAKNKAYILANGLKVRAYAKKAYKIDYSNGTAQFLALAMDIYAPWPFCKLRSGRNKLLEILNDKYIRLEDQDVLLIREAIGQSFYRQKKWAKSKEWFLKALEVYPQNLTSLGMVEKNDEKLKKKGWFF